MGGEAHASVLRQLLSLSFIYLPLLLTAPAYYLATYCLLLAQYYLLNTTYLLDTTATATATILLHINK